MTFDQISLILTQINDYYYYRKKESFPFYIYNQLIEDLTRAPENNKNFHFICAVYLFPSLSINSIFILSTFSFVSKINLGFSLITEVD